MSIETKTAKELTEQYLANFENTLDQDSPLNDKAFLRVLSANQALLTVEMIKLAQIKTLSNLALTAFGDDLEKLGAEYDVIKKQAQAAVINFDLPGTNGVEISQSKIFTGDSNGLQYFLENSVIISGGVAALTGTAENTGVEGNLNIGETLSINSQVPGAETVATVTGTVTLGLNEEAETAFKRRVLTAIRRRLGGYGFIDNRQFAEETPGVFKAYPFTGRPGIVGSVPPERTVYIEADPLIDPDGIAPQILLDEARLYLTANQETGVSRLTLGMTDEKLFVESITRLLIYVEIRGLITPAGQETQVQDAIDASLADYFLNLEMFITGLDAEEDRNDIITDLSVSDIVQDILRINNSNANGVGFGLSPGSFLGIYTLFPGELAKSGGVNYA
jgi:hypothetical protein